MESDIEDCTAALLTHWRAARRAPCEAAAERHYQLTILYKAQLLLLRRPKKSASAVFY
jgi:hypothetical protein